MTWQYRMVIAMRRSALLLVIVLGACSGNSLSRVPESADVNAYPQNYKSDVLAFLRTYLNDPTNVREAYISDPTMKAIGFDSRYVVCLRFNARKVGGDYAGSRDRLAIFVGGRFDRLIEAARDQCKEMTLAPFPELERLAR